ncbi:hypothetical protein M0638_07485 [Roseomonas sp. NAR14]|uniref:Uncharacterized protein n=1 Tax=Roseomonas acroporae TaxID=2937791 RepID=A0A9X1Y673_9PROT|nr:hypothetical protein [Roseomonas acroporae]MCK8784218.1 hypothetical protein [Roseomonas acroporae]
MLPASLLPAFAPQALASQALAPQPAPGLHFSVDRRARDQRPTDALRAAARALDLMLNTERGISPIEAQRVLDQLRLAIAATEG